MSKIVHCKKSLYDIYCGRGKCPRTGKYYNLGNPYSHKEGTAARFKASSLDESINSFESYVKNRMENDKEFKDSIESCKDQVLGCWCYPNRCHCEVIHKLAGSEGY
jgi:hypothetical protein